MTDLDIDLQQMALIIIAGMSRGIEISQGNLRILKNYRKSIDFSLKHRTELSDLPLFFEDLQKETNKLKKLRRKYRSLKKIRPMNESEALLMKQAINEVAIYIDARKHDLKDWLYREHSYSYSIRDNSSVLKSCIRAADKHFEESNRNIIRYRLDNPGYKGFAKLISGRVNEIVLGKQLIFIGYSKG